MQMTPEEEEGHWIERHLAGDPTAFSCIIARYERPVMAYLSRCGIDGASADDIFQEIFVRVHRGAGSYNSERPFRVWLFTIVANTMRSHFRHRAVRTRKPARDYMPPPAPLPHAAEVLEARRTASALQEALELLPERQREVIILIAVEQLNHEQVAEVLSIPVGTVKTYARRARLALAKALRRREVTAERESSG